MTTQTDTQQRRSMAPWESRFGEAGGEVKGANHWILPDSPIPQPLAGLI